MAKKINMKELVHVSFSLFLICFITALLLSAADYVTREPIAKNAEETLLKARSSVVPGAVSSEEKKVDEEIYFEMHDADGKPLGYAIETSANGYGGKISVTTGFNGNGEILAVSVVAADDETPGLGTKVKSELFLDQFKGKKVPFVLVKSAGKMGADNEIDAITSATFSSTGVIDAVNDAIRLCAKVVKGR